MCLLVQGDIQHWFILQVNEGGQKEGEEVSEIFKEIRRRNKTQFEIERRSCGPSMTNLGSLVVGVKLILQVVILFYDVHFRNLTKKMEKMSKINPVVVLY